MHQINVGFLYFMIYVFYLKTGSLNDTTKTLFKGPQNALNKLRIERPKVITPLSSAV